ncbi:hypothetical protein EYF80_020936 [Liparis tanakae]|uniref:Uncharacterized protein n=1 Tax=Liparis tanakae TaxID=230148 RepID=A0A4Z2HTM2_9TELE|nr:hypothetical protein EYF80_020936 [Liparis tanakae]
MEGGSQQTPPQKHSQAVRGWRRKSTASSQRHRALVLKRGERGPVSAWEPAGLRSRLLSISGLSGLSDSSFPWESQNQEVGFQSSVLGGAPSFPVAHTPDR